MSQLIPTQQTKLSEEEATFALRQGWNQVFGNFPSDDSLAILWAHSALETGRWTLIYNYNFGNIKKTTDHDYCMYRCSEIINGKNIYFEPPHYQTHFNSYPTAVAGATEYLQFVSQRSRYQVAWQELLAGNPVKYCAALKQGGYFTADLISYTKGVVSLTDEFKSKKDKLLTWKPETPVTESKSEEVSETLDLVKIIPESPKLTWWQLLWQFLCQILKIK